jgi:hypothetical protein
MIDCYGVLLGTEVLFRYPLGAWISNDEANHRIALIAFPNFVEDPEKDTRTGLHHTAFETPASRSSTRATCGSRRPGSCRTSASTTG